MTAMFTVRAAVRADFDALMELARLSGPGFTSLPADEELLASRLEKAEAAYADPNVEQGAADYILILEDEAARVTGCAAVKAMVGVDRPFFNFKILRTTHASHVTETRYDTDIAVLVNEYAGCTEVGSLFVRKEARGGGVGRMLTQARYLLMAADPARFAPTVIAELRGVVDEAGKSPFWEALGAKFFRMPFPDADLLSATTDNQFITDLMPRYPIYLDLMPPEARAVIGAPHPDGVGAMKLLQWEGFRYDRVVDIFDGGPLVTAPRSDIRTIRESRAVTVEAGEALEGWRSVILSTDRIENFRVRRARAVLNGDAARVDKDALKAVGLETGDRARIWAGT